MLKRPGPHYEKGTPFMRARLPADELSETAWKESAMAMGNDRGPLDPAIRVMMMPRDTNAHGTIFGGVILSYVDQAGAVEARKHGCAHVVTVAMDSVEFKQPVFVGDVLSFYTSTIRAGRTSVRIRVQVEAERFAPPCERVPVTAAEVVYVAVDEQRRPIPFTECNRLA